jgi:hypothetical protein
VFAIPPCFSLENYDLDSFPSSTDKFNSLSSLLQAQSSSLRPISPALVCIESGRNSRALVDETHSGCILSLMCDLEKNANAVAPVRLSREVILKIGEVFDQIESADYLPLLQFCLL